MPDEVSAEVEQQVEHSKRGRVDQHKGRTQRLLNEHLPLTPVEVTTHNHSEAGGLCNLYSTYSTLYICSCTIVALAGMGCFLACQ